MILLLAETNMDAQKFVLDHALTPESFKFLTGKALLLGTINPYVCRIGTYWQRRDIMVVERELSERGAIYLSTLDVINKVV